MFTDSTEYRFTLRLRRLWRRASTAAPGRRMVIATVTVALVVLPMRLSGVVGYDTTPSRAGSSDEETLLEAGLRALRDGKSPLAVSLLRASVDEEGRLDPEAWLGLGVAYGRMERWNAAIDALERSIGELPDPLSGWTRYLQARFLVSSGRSDAADSLLSREELAETDGPLGERIHAVQLELARARGDRERESEILDHLIRGREGNAAGHAIRLAELLQEDDPDESAALRRRALDLPGSDEARGEGARFTLSADSVETRDALRAGQALYGLADWPGATGAFRMALESATTGEEATEARYRLGLSLYRNRDHRLAIEQFEKVVESPGRYRTSAAYYRARSIVATAGRETGAAALIAVADRFPRSRWAPRALKLAAERLGIQDCAAARDLLARLISDYPTHWENAEALFQLGNCARRNGDREAAQRWYVQLGNGVYHPHEKAQGFFWAGRMAEGRGDTAAAASYLARAADRYPDTFYGALAADELGRPSMPTVSLPEWGADGGLSVPDWAAADLAAGIVLLRVGRREEGELQMLHAIDSGSTDRERLYGLWSVCVEGRAFDAAVRLGEVLLRRFRWSEDDERYRNLSYPLYYADLIESEAERNRLDPLLILALMKQESLFLSDARSYAGARGLMQLMPETAREWARRLRLPQVDEEDLYDPSLSLRLGIPYFARLVRQFDGSVIKALAAYNAGATSVRRWERRLADERPETFVESIGYQETRTYVRTILNNYYRYRYLWNQPPS